MDRFAPARRALDDQVTAGRFPGYVLATRAGGRDEVRAGGCDAVDGEPLRPDARFRTASITKPVGAALALALADDGVLDLDAPVATWLPELAEPRVLLDPAGPLDATEPAHRPVLVRDLLLLTPGFGYVPQDGPLPRAMEEAGLGPSGGAPGMSPDEHLARLAALPFAAQPGTRWLYHTAFDVLGTLLARRTGRALPDLLQERLLGPLGLTATGFWAAPWDLVTAYQVGAGGLEVIDPPDGAWATPPRFPSLAAGLVSTAADLLTFAAAVRDGGRGVLSGAAVRRLTTDQLSPAQRTSGAPVLDEGTSWTCGAGVVVAEGQEVGRPGTWGWAGGLGTHLWADPVRDLVVVVLTQACFDHTPGGGFAGFWRALADG
ncbi:serine hydrolase domain-containing protein [Kineococcus rubinsiae]|uniref:serine hydrolase domain-containing protein n=1 Tax=Kineococcus rubinsiae TaxID=2609562 RepID=UPI0014308A83|nr:serine hydrolase domain-containing protein [Kineococcus rubinsiae]